MNHLGREDEEPQNPGNGSPPDIPDICVISIRARESTQTATYELMEILAEITSVSLVTVLLADESPIFDRFDVVELSDRGTGWSLWVATFRYGLNQLRMCRELLRRDEEIVLFYGATTYLIPIVFAKLLGLTVILEPRGDVPLTLKLRWREDVPAPVARIVAGAVRVLEYLGYSSASAIVTYTPGMARELGLERFRSKLYMRGARHVDVERFEPEVEFEERDDLVGFIGRFEVEKRIPELIEVARLLAPNIQFLFVGEGSYGEVIQESLAVEIERGDVEVLDWLPHNEVPEQLNRMRLLILPSQPTEGLPTVILEAFACGTPVYATPVSGVPDVVCHGETGFLIGDADPKLMADSIGTILTREDLPAISRRARSRVVEEYSFQATVDRYREMLIAIVDK